MPLSFALKRGFEVIGHVADGAYGSVWKCSGTDEAGEARTYAVKVMRDFKCATRMVTEQQRLLFLKRIYREILVLDLFKHCDEFIKLLDVYTSPDGLDLYLVMPFIDHSLYSVMSSEGVKGVGLGENLTRYVLMQILVGLSRMEACHCIHRDLSLGNVLIGSEAYDVYLADFGLSRAYFDPGQEISDDVVTLPYRPPEVLLRGGSKDNKIDIWSAGAIAMELLRGRPFLHTKDELTLLAAMIDLVDKPDSLEEAKGYVGKSALNYLEKSWGYISNKSPKPLSDSLPPVSQECLDVLQCMLRFNPAQRLSARGLLEMPWFQNDADTKNVMDELLQNKDAPVEGLCSDVEQMSDEKMIEHIVSRASNEEITQVVTLDYDGKHENR